MHEQESFDTDLAAFEKELAGLSPRASLDRDQLMFEAGRRSAGGQFRVMNRMLLATTLLLATITSATIWRQRVAQQGTPPVKSLAADSAAESSSSASANRPTVDRNDDVSVAATSGASHRRMLQDWSARQAFPSETSASSPPDSWGSVPSSDSHTSRSLLMRYLDSSIERL